MAPVRSAMILDDHEVRCLRGFAEGSPYRLEVGAQGPNRGSEDQVVARGEVQSLPADEAVTDDLDLTIPPLLEDSISDGSLRFVELAIEPHIFAIDMSRPYSHGMEVLRESHGLGHTGGVKEGGAGVGVVLLPFVMNASDDRMGPDFLADVTHGVLPGLGGLDTGKIHLIGGIDDRLHQGSA